MNYEQILYDVEDHVLTITLNRPEKLNAFTDQMRDEILDALDHADADDEVRAIIFTGAGRGFCAGKDLSAGAGTFNHDEDGSGFHRDGGGLVTLRLFDCRKPVIAACNGPAVGIGSTMQCAMDVRLASESARYGFVFSRRGIVPEACSSWFLPRVVGISTALEWSYSGRIIEAEEALERRFVRSVHPAEDLLPAARALAHEFAAQTSSVSVTLIRHMMWKMLGADHPMEAHKIDSRGIYHMGKSGDAAEGIASFLEKRPAEFPGKVSQDMPEFFPWWQDRDFS
ncbi:MAG: crotonase/enoyl-CoA hydratase family protein [Proteobacteria bacterium]|jgi:enoyl-CoA hydratase/carnithine racemase|nr:crotonase/enoyl-CoA hydratase family protein [Pseudomonadota bacterium]MDA1299540.1 crotonase/enoyl-CoA hydratase family protein [Pseudomonadota bacterium]